ncbi:MAG: hypothetical protein V3V78_00305 [Candidatus Woesearchaeota archaeon]
MENLSIVPGDTGYFKVLQAFRTDVPFSTKEHYPFLKTVVEGNIPEEVKKHLPIFGANPMRSRTFPTYTTLNSGGRGLLLSDGKTHLRFKGNDVDGSITQTVGYSPKNHIPDIERAAEFFYGDYFDTDALDEGVIYNLPNYGSKPFSFFTPESIDKEMFACEALANGFTDKGFKAPYSYAGSVTYPTIQWQGKSCGTLVFELPSIESDFRYEEFYRHAFMRLKFAKPKELEAIKEDFCDFGLKLTTWFGFVARLMEENKLVPTSESEQHQNYVLAHVSDTEIGASRVDHTSTVENPDEIEDYIAHRKSGRAFFASQALDFLHALELIKQGYKFDKDRYTGYFDRAVKWHQGYDINKFPKIVKYWNKIDKAFNRGYQNKDPVPISQDTLIDLVDKIGKVKVDEEWQQRVTMNQLKALGLPFLEE